MASAHDVAVDTARSVVESTPTCGDECSEEAFIHEHGLALAVSETERLARERFRHAFRGMECVVRIDGDFGTEYLHASVLINADVATLLDAEPAFFAALAHRVPDVDWSSILVSLRLAPDTD